MIGFKNKQQFKEWKNDQLKKYGIKQPDMYVPIEQLKNAIETRKIEENEEDLG